MTGEAPTTSGQQFNKDTAHVLSSDRTTAGGNENNICIQTGEEFATEFLQDRVALRRLPHPQKRVGFNFNQNHQLVHEDPIGVVGLQGSNSDCDSGVTEFVPGTRYGAEVEKKAYADNMNRYYREYVAAGQVPGNFTHESNPDRGISGPIAPPLYAVESPQSHYTYGPGFSEGSFTGKMKFLCSFGGRILPRPTDSKLRYVGGETRIVSIRKNITWEELMKKTYAICNQPHTIKYQLPGEDLDALISVCSDEDLHHMLEEYQEPERIEGSQRLRIFLISSNDPESPSSVEGRGAQPSDVDYQYVIAVNGMVDKSPQSLTSQTSQFGNTSDYSPTFPRDSPTSPYALEIQDCSPSSLNKAGMFSNPASQFLAALQIPSKSFNQSPPISPVQHRDPNNPYYVDAMGYYHNILHGPPLMNYHHPYKYLVETDQANISHDRHFHYCIPSKDVHSPSYGQSEMKYERPMHKDRSFHSDKVSSHPDDPTSLWSGSNGTDGSHRKIMHVFSDSQLQKHDERSKCHFLMPSLSFGREKSLTFAISNCAEECPIQRKEIIDDKHQIAKYENQPSFKTPKDCKENFELGQEMFSWTDRITPCSDPNQQQFEGHVEVTSHDNAMDLKKLPDLNCLPSVCLSSQEPQNLGEVISVSPVIPSESSADSMSKCSHGYHLDATAPKVLIMSQNPNEDKQCTTNETLSGQAVSDWYPGILPVAAKEMDDQESMVPSSVSITLCKNEFISKIMVL